MSNDVCARTHGSLQVKQLNMVTGVTCLMFIKKRQTDPKGSLAVCSERIEDATAAVPLPHVPNYYTIPDRCNAVDGFVVRPTCL